MILSHKYKLNPTKEQIKFFENNFGACRFIYNWALNRKKSLWEDSKDNITEYELSAELTKLKKKEEYKWLKLINANTLNKELKNLNYSYNKYFDKKGNFPKFKNKYDKKSFTCIQAYNIVNDIKTNYNCKIDFEKGRIKIPKIDWLYFWNKNYKFEGDISQITI
jgi:putative transposase